MMQFILDSIFSSFLLLFLLFIVVLIIATRLAKADFFKNKTLNFLFSGLGYVWFALFSLMGGVLNPRYFGYGYATEFNNILVSDKYVCFLDYRMAGEAESIGTPYYRLHTLDILTGEKIYKKNNWQRGAVF